MTDPRPDSPTPSDYPGGSDDVPPSDQAVSARAEALLPEELAVGSDDPHAQAEVILEDSERRTDVPDAAPSTHLERRRSQDTI
jgi:hypothetical protein